MTSRNVVSGPASGTAAAVSSFGSTVRSVASSPGNDDKRNRETCMRRDEAGQGSCQMPDEVDPGQLPIAATTVGTIMGNTVVA